MLKYILLFVLLGFTACELNEEDLLSSIVGEAESVPAGTYISQCVLSQTDSSSSIFTLNMSSGSYTIQENTYSDSECSADEAVGVVSEAVSADLPGPNLGDGFSFFSNSEGLKVPYFYQDAQLVLGEPQESLPSGEDDFSGFQQDLEAGIIPIYQLQ